VLEVDAANRPVRVVEEVPPINGFDVQLTLDLEAQQYLEQTLETTLKARRGQTAENPIVKKPDGTREQMDLSQGPRVAYKAPAASGLIMDYTTGDVLAMASYPGFDNRWFEAGISGDKFAEVFPITEDPDKSILVNRAVQGRYNLGSTFKPFTAYAALSTGLLAPGDYYLDRGTYTLSNESVSSDKCVSGLVKCEYKNATCGNGLPCRYGGVNVESALAVSSDTFFYRVGEQIMLRNDFQPVLQAQLRLFGFGADTGIELPFEFDGTVPRRRDPRRRRGDRGPHRLRPLPPLRRRGGRVSATGTLHPAASVGSPSREDGRGRSAARARGPGGTDPRPAHLSCSVLTLPFTKVNPVES
jgi:penicillin-binding protein 2